SSRRRLRLQFEGREGTRVPHSSFRLRYRRDRRHARRQLTLAGGDARDFGAGAYAGELPADNPDGGPVPLRGRIGDRRVCAALDREAAGLPGGVLVPSGAPAEWW